MWFSTETKVFDVDINTEIFKLIQDTMEQPNSEWYAVTCSKLYESIKLSVIRREQSSNLTVLLRETKYSDIFGEWHDYSDCTARDIAQSLVIFMAKVEDANTNSKLAMQTLLDLEGKLRAFPTNVTGWHYNYSKIKPVVQKIETLQYLKISSDLEVRSKYISLYDDAQRLYNSYQSLSR